MKLSGPTRAISLLLAGALGLSAASLAAVERDLSLTRFNRVYNDLAGEVPPIDLPPVTITLTSSHQSILIKDNRIHMTALGGGRFSGSIALELLGKGDLVADVDLGGRSQQLTDEVLVPRQRVEVAGIVHMSRVDGGYRLVTEKLPAAVRVAIRSRLVGRLLDTCAGAALLSFGSLDCDPVATALENPEVPLPAAGSEFFLSDGDLTADDRAAFDALLAVP